MKSSKRTIYLSLIFLLILSSCCLLVTRADRKETTVTDCRGLVAALNESSGNETIAIRPKDQDRQREPLVCEATDSIVISKDGITIDGNSNTIVAASNEVAAIKVQGAKDVVIRDIIVIKGEHGIHVDSKSTALLSTVTANDNRVAGVLIGEDIPVIPIEELQDPKGGKQKSYDSSERAPARQKGLLSTSYPRYKSEDGDSTVVSWLRSTKFSLVKEAIAATCTRSSVDGAIEITGSGGNAELCGVDMHGNGAAAIRVTNANLSIRQIVNLTGPGVGTGVGLQISSGRVTMEIGANVVETGHATVPFGGQGLVVYPNASVVCPSPNSVMLSFASGKTVGAPLFGTNEGCPL